jgi:hypothetical protein
MPVEAEDGVGEARRELRKPILRLLGLRCQRRRQRDDLSDDERRDADQQLDGAGAIGKQPDGPRCQQGRARRSQAAGADRRHRAEQGGGREQERRDLGQQAGRDRDDRQQRRRLGRGQDGDRRPDEPG